VLILSSIVNIHPELFNFVIKHNDENLDNKFNFLRESKILKEDSL
jgi:hypothetical protein